MQGQAEGPTAVITHSMLTSCQQLASSWSTVLPITLLKRDSELISPSWGHTAPPPTAFTCCATQHNHRHLPLPTATCRSPRQGHFRAPSHPGCLGHRYLPHLASNKRPQISTIDTRGRAGGNFVPADGLWTSFLLVWGTWGILFKIRSLTLPMWACKGFSS